MIQKFDGQKTMASAKCRIVSEDYEAFLKKTQRPALVLGIILTVLGAISLFCSLIELSGIYVPVFFLIIGIVMLVNTPATRKKLVTSFQTEHYQCDYHFYEFGFEATSVSEHMDSTLRIPYGLLDIVYDRGDMLYLQYENRVYFLRKNDINGDISYVCNCLATQAKKFKQITIHTVGFPTPPPPMSAQDHEEEIVSSPQSAHACDTTGSFYYAPPHVGTGYTPQGYTPQSYAPPAPNAKHPLRTICLTFFILSLALFPVAIVLLGMTNDPTLFDIAPFLQFLLLPIIGVTLTSLILGIIGSRKKARCNKNIISGAILLLFLFIMYTTCSAELAMYSDDLTYIHETEKIMDVALPDSGVCMMDSVYIYDQDFSEAKRTVLHAMDKADLDVMYEQFQNDQRWQKSPEVNSIPSDLYFEVDSAGYCMIYNVTNGTFNEPPAVGQKQEIILLVYNMELDCLYIYEYSVVPGLSG